VLLFFVLLNLNSKYIWITIVEQGLNTENERSLILFPVMWESLETSLNFPSPPPNHTHTHTPPPPLKIRSWVTTFSEDADESLPYFYVKHVVFDSTFNWAFYRFIFRYSASSLFGYFVVTRGLRKRDPSPSVLRFLTRTVLMKKSNLISQRANLVLQLEKWRQAAIFFDEY